MVTSYSSSYRDVNLSTEQQRYLNHPSSNTVLIAGSGSGKTFMIINKIIQSMRRLGLLEPKMLKRRIGDGEADIKPKIIAITFTTKAAEELKVRLISGVIQHLNINTESPAELHLPESIWIGTIHCISLRLLKHFEKKENYSVWDSEIILEALEYLIKKEYPYLIKIKDEVESEEETIFCPPPAVSAAVASMNDSGKNKKKKVIPSPKITSRYSSSSTLTGDKNSSLIGVLRCVETAFQSYRFSHSGNNPKKRECILYQNFVNFPHHVLCSAGICEFRTIYQNYRDLLLQCDALDYPEMILRCIEQLKDKNPPNSENILTELKEVFVDEFQDVNELMFQFVMELKNTNKSSSLNVVGDDDQSIYSFQGSSAKYLKKLVDEFQFSLFTLNRSFRHFDENIGDAIFMANKLLRNNSGRIGKGKDIKIYNSKTSKVEIPRRIRFRIEFSNCVSVMHYADQFDEVRGILKHILQHSRRNASIAVIYRHNKIGGIEIPKLFQMALKGRFHDMECGLKISEFKALISKFSFNMIMKEEMKLSEGEQIWSLASKSSKNHKDFIIRKKLRKIDHFKIFKNGKMIKNLNYKKLKKKIEKRIKKTQEFKENLKRIKIQIEMSYKKKMTVDRKQKKSKQNSSSISLNFLTCHASKGLEFDHVYLISAADHNYPSRYLTESLEEERRLLFVAMTRAKKRLNFSYHVTTDSILGGGASKNRITRFLQEMLPRSNKSH